VRTVVVLQQCVTIPAQLSPAPPNNLSKTDMAETKTIAASGKDYSVTLKRFDDCTELGGPSYHGYHVAIQGNGLALNARKYDDENELSVQSGVDETNPEAIEIVREIARQLFGTERLSLLTRDNPSPYKEV
jgi:hypothetical protein